MKAQHRDLHQGNRGGQGTHPWSSRDMSLGTGFRVGLRGQRPSNSRLLIYISAPNGGPTTRAASSQYTQTGT